MTIFVNYANIVPGSKSQMKSGKVYKTTATVQVMKDTRPFVPALEGNLNNTTHIEHGNQIVYPPPYARYLYYGKVMVEENGQHAFYVPNVGWRHHVGSHLHAIDKDLVFSTEMHPKALAHWFEASKALNLDKWKKVLAKAVVNRGK